MNLFRKHFFVRKGEYIGFAREMEFKSPVVVSSWLGDVKFSHRDIHGAMVYVAPNGKIVKIYP
jgi:hypothetical protein